MVTAKLGDTLWVRFSRGGLFYAPRDENIWLGIYPWGLRIASVGDPGFGAPTGLCAWNHGFLFRGPPPGLRGLPLFYRTAKECGVNPEPFLQLDRVIHEKGRLAIMSMLAAAPELSFTEMRDALEMTDGNLTTHIRTLQEAGYVSVSKSYQNNRPLTTCSLTPRGKKAFTTYINLLEEIIQQNRPK